MAENPQFETLTQSLSPTLQSLEQKRKELKKQGQSTGIWVGGVVFVIVSAFSVYINAALIGVGIAAGLALLAYYSCVNAKSQELSSYYKQKVIAQVLQSFCDNAIFTPEEGIKEGIFRSCGLFTSPDRYHTEDLIQGRVGKTDFSCAEVHAEERTNESLLGRYFQRFPFHRRFSERFSGAHHCFKEQSVQTKLQRFTGKAGKPGF